MNHTKAKLGVKLKGRSVEGVAGGYVLRQEAAPYSIDFGLEKGVLRAVNAYCWQDPDGETGGLVRPHCPRPKLKA